MGLGQEDARRSIAEVGGWRTWWLAGESEVPHDTEVSSLTTDGKLRYGAPDPQLFGGKEVCEFSFRRPLCFVSEHFLD